MNIIKDSIILNFLDSLLSEGKSKVSIKNYKSDIGHFLAWATLKLKTSGVYTDNISEIAPFIDQKFFESYRDYMVDNGIKTKTVNRRLSSLRRLSHFLTENGILDSDYMIGIRNVGIGIPEKVQKISLDIVEEFRKSLLEKDKASENTAKNYASDVRSFLAWIDKKQNAAQSR